MTSKMDYDAEPRIAGLKSAKKGHVDRVNNALCLRKADGRSHEYNYLLISVSYQGVFTMRQFY